LDYGCLKILISPVLSLLEATDHDIVEHLLLDRNASKKARGIEVTRCVDWPWSSSRWYDTGQSAAVPLAWVSGLELPDA
jgi:hypothetical protein